jgi:hypothetical protein
MECGTSGLCCANAEINDNVKMAGSKSGKRPVRVISKTSEERLANAGLKVFSTTFKKRR